MGTEGSRRRRRRDAVIALVAAGFLLLGFSAFNSTGHVGCTRKNGYGCVCHGINIPSDEVVMMVSGPSRVRSGSTNNFTFTMTGGPQVAGGFNVAAAQGALSPADTTAQLMENFDGFELTHTSPKPFEGDTVRWTFRYTAPAGEGDDTLFCAGNSVNLDLNPTGDEFNLGPDFIVHRSDTTDGVGAGAAPAGYRLDQNYPNPFNPLTTVRYAVAARAAVRLTVVDILGREVKALAGGQVSPGEHTAVWDGTLEQGQAAPSGIYFLRFTAAPGGRSAFSGVRKMLLAR